MPARRSTGLTGYAVLGLLARAPRSGYELAGVLTRGVGANLFARGASESYAEPRRLVAQGLVDATTEWHGRRSRTVYRLTAGGRAALARWLSSPSAPPVVEAEALLKVFFADAVPAGDPARSVHEVAAWAAARFDEGELVLARYAAGEAPHGTSARLARLALLANLELTDAFARWAQRARRELDDDPPEGYEDLVAELAERRRRYADPLDGPR